MAFDKKNTTYSGHDAVGSAEELDTYGVWVKSEPQDLTAGLAGVVDFDADADAVPYEADFDADFADSALSNIGMADIDSEIPEIKVEDSHNTFDDEITAHSGQNAGDNQLLTKIADELSAIRSELNTLKKEFADIRAENAPAEKEEPQGGGFFSDAEDEKIALTGDEMEDFLTSAHFSDEEEHPFDADVQRDADEAALRELSEKNEISSDHISDFDEPDDTIEELSPIEDQDELDHLRMEGAVPVTPAPDDAAYLESDPFVLDNSDFEAAALDEDTDNITSHEDPVPADVNLGDMNFDLGIHGSEDTFGEEHLDLSDAVIDEPDLSAGLVEAPLEEPLLEDITFGDDLLLDIGDTAMGNAMPPAEEEPPLADPEPALSLGEDDLSLNDSDFSLDDAEPSLSLDDSDFSLDCFAKGTEYPETNTLPKQQPQVVDDADPASVEDDAEHEALADPEPSLSLDDSDFSLDDAEPSLSLDDSDFTLDDAEPASVPDVEEISLEDEAPALSLDDPEPSLSLDDSDFSLGDAEPALSLDDDISTLSLDDSDFSLDDAEPVSVPDVEEISLEDEAPALSLDDAAEPSLSLDCLAKGTEYPETNTLPKQQPQVVDDSDFTLNDADPVLSLDEDEAAADTPDPVFALDESELSLDDSDFTLNDNADNADEAPLDLNIDEIVLDDAEPEALAALDADDNTIDDIALDDFGLDTALDESDFTIDAAIDLDDADDHVKPHAKTGSHHTDEDDDTIAQVIPEGFEVNAKDAAISLDDDIEAFAEDEFPVIEEEASEIEAPAAVKLPEAEAIENADIPAGMKDELKDMLSYMNDLLESLPDDKLKEFAASKQFGTYHKIFKELGLV